QQSLTLNVSPADANHVIRIHEVDYGRQDYSTCALCLSAPGKVIRVHAADYGRRNSQTCAAGRPASQLQNVHCLSSTPTYEVARTCDDFADCTFIANGSVIHDPCPSTYKYLQVTYFCKAP
uniref:SUEL-type lectin domain-containing protein n=1 Tax=Neogobius melanostomus TaxID=47308 RepID=A0A8C6SHJ4_9GOBI